MKIVQIIYSLELGGAEKFVVDISNELVKKHEVFLITFKTDLDISNQFHFPDLSKRVNYTNLKLKRGINIPDVISVYKLLKKINPDVVHCHLGVIFHVLPYTFFNRKKKFFHTIHNDAKFDSSNKPGTFIRKFVYKKSIFVPVTISGISRESFNSFYKLNNPILIYNGSKIPVKTSNFEKVKEEINQYKIQPDDQVFIHVGRQEPIQKNQLMLVKVFNRLINEGHHLILLIIGNDFDKPEAKVLKETANAGIYFCGAKQNIADYYLNADAFCLSSNYEGMPISLLEALASGCVPICTPVGGIINVIENGVTGYLSDNTSEQAYYLAVKKFLNNKNEVDRNHLVAHYKNNYSIEKSVADHENLYASNY